VNTAENGIVDYDTAVLELKGVHVRTQRTHRKQPVVVLQHLRQGAFLVTAMIYRPLVIVDIGLVLASYRNWGSNTLSGLRCVQVHCSATGRDIVPDVEAVRLHVASEKYVRAARVASADFTTYQVGKWGCNRMDLGCCRVHFRFPQPFVVPHKEFPTKLFCVVTKTTLNKVEWAVRWLPRLSGVGVRFLARVVGCRTRLRLRSI
jgi:hypothetical protein